MSLTCFVVIAMLGLLASVVQEPLVFPPLGATTFLLVTAPDSPGARPRAVLLSHAFAMMSGYFALAMFGLLDAPPISPFGFDLMRCFTIAVALAMTAGLMQHFDAAHPPAGATTLVVSLGALHKPSHMAIMELGAAVVVLQCVAIAKLARA